MRATKIVATLGPASSSPGSISDLLSAGVDVVRLNFSHGSLEEHAERIARVREAAAALGRPVALLQDLQGPKIRTGPLRGGGPVELRAGRELRITTRDADGDEECISTGYAELASDVRAGDRILLSDGLMELRVARVDGGDVVTEIVNGGMLRERQGMNLPGVRISAPALTEKDVRDLAFGLEHGVDYVALSFVRREEDVLEVKRRISAAGLETPVIAKLEKPEAIAHLEEILTLADGAMVARGDLGVEISPERVPLVQKRVIALANALSKPVITATQMLESMIENPRPTRAEASDVANAILDGTDAVMLSGETAVGRHPVAAVRTMARVAEELQAHPGIFARADAVPFGPGAFDSAPPAIGAAVSAIVRSMPQVDAIWVITQSGSSARLVAHHRPHIPVVAMTPDERVHRRLSLVWGVRPVLCEFARDAAELERSILAAAAREGLARPGQTLVLTGSHPFADRAPTNFLKIQRI